MGVGWGSLGPAILAVLLCPTEPAGAASTGAWVRSFFGRKFPVPISRELLKWVGPLLWPAPAPCWTAPRVHKLHAPPSPTPMHITCNVQPAQVPCMVLSTRGVEPDAPRHPGGTLTQHLCEHGPHARPVALLCAEWQGAGIIAGIPGEEGEGASQLAWPVRGVGLRGPGGPCTVRGTCLPALPVGSVTTMVGRHQRSRSGSAGHGCSAAQAASLYRAGSVAWQIEENAHTHSAGPWPLARHALHQAPRPLDWSSLLYGSAPSRCLDLTSRNRTATTCHPLQMSVTW